MFAVVVWFLIYLLLFFVLPSPLPPYSPSLTIVLLLLTSEVAAHTYIFNHTPSLSPL